MGKNHSCFFFAELSSKICSPLHLWLPFHKLGVTNRWTVVQVWSLKLFFLAVDLYLMAVTYKILTEHSYSQVFTALVQLPGDSQINCTHQISPHMKLLSQSNLALSQRGEAESRKKILWVWDIIRHVICSFFPRSIQHEASINNNVCVVWSATMGHNMEPLESWQMPSFITWIHDSLSRT